MVSALFSLGYLARYVSTKGVPCVPSTEDSLLKNAARDLTSGLILAGVSWLQGISSRYDENGASTCRAWVEVECSYLHVLLEFQVSVRESWDEKGGYMSVLPNTAPCPSSSPNHLVSWVTTVKRAARYLHIERWISRWSTLHRRDCLM